MNYIKILILFSAVFCMETFGMAYIQQKDLLGEKPLPDRIKYLFPMTVKRRVYYGLTMLTGLCLSSALIFVYPENTIFIQKIRMAALYGILCPIALIDLRTQKIPNKLLLLACVIWVFSVMAELVKNPELVFRDVKNSMVAAVVVFLICILCKCLIKNGIGMGYIKLFMVMGLLQGISGMSGAIFMSMIVAFFGSVGMLILKKKTRKDNISFGPFILIGTTISMFLAGV